MSKRRARLRQSRSAVHTLDVRLGAARVGTLTHVGGEDIVFAFDREYIEDADARPTLSLGFKAADGGLVQRARPTHVRLLPFFSNLLPEGHLRDYLAARGGVHRDREFFLIWLLGADLPGAVRIHPAEDIAMPALDDEESREGEQDREPLRFSLAGVQLKFSAIVEGSKGPTLPADGIGGDWIVKLPSARFEAVPENEYAVMTLAGKVGIDVPQVELILTRDIRGVPQELPEVFGHSLAIRRFDRPRKGRRVHIEDFAQVFGVYPEKKYRTASYSNIARVLWIEVGEEAIVQLMRRLAFNALIGNADAHLKNWSLIYHDGRTPQLAPAYDLVSTVPYIGGDGLALSLDDTKDFKRIDVERFGRFAQKAGLPVRLVQRVARETGAAVRDLWPTHEPARALPARIRKAVTTHMRQVPL